MYIENLPLPARIVRFTQKYTKLQFFPLWEHIDDASELEHEQRDDVERVVVSWIKYVDGPNVNVQNVIAFGNQMLIQAMKMTAKTNILLHT